MQNTSVQNASGLGWIPTRVREAFFSAGVFLVSGSKLVTIQCCPRSYLFTSKSPRPISPWDWTESPCLCIFPAQTVGEKSNSRGQQWTEWTHRAHIPGWLFSHVVLQPLKVQRLRGQHHLNYRTRHYLTFSLIHICTGGQNVRDWTGAWAWIQAAVLCTLQKHTSAGE